MSVAEHPDPAAAPVGEASPSAEPTGAAVPDLAASAEPATVTTDAPIEPGAAGGSLPGVAEPAQAAPVPQARTKTKGVADLVFLRTRLGRRRAGKRRVR